MGRPLLLGYLPVYLHDDGGGDDGRNAGLDKGGGGGDDDDDNGGGSTQHEVPFRCDGCGGAM